MSLIYQGKVTFSDLAPGLSEAASSLDSQADDITGFLTDKQAGISAMQKRVAAMQAEMSRAQSAADDAQQILDDASELLDQAKSLVSNISAALETSGIYHYNYVGRIDGLGSAAAAEFSDGLPDRQTHPDDSVAAILLIVGGDGGTEATVEKITGLFGQIGDNAQDIIGLYS